MSFFTNIRKTRCHFIRLLAGSACALVLALSASTLDAQTATNDASFAVPKFVYTNKGKMSTYRNLAQLAYECYLRGEDDKAAVLGKIIERTYDKTEGDLEKSNKDLYGKIDMSMDKFIKPLMYYVKSGRPDSVKERQYFEDYLKNLAQAD